MKQTNYFKVGLFTALSLGLVILFLVFLGVSNLFQTTELAETYFDESVQGLNIGSAVKYRGVTVGKVTAIGMVNQLYNSEEHMRQTQFELQPICLGFPYKVRRLHTA